MNLFKIFVFFTLILSVAAVNSSVAAQKAKRRNVKTRIEKKQKFAKNMLARKSATTISYGVVNAHTAKPEDLVKPIYPSAAKMLRIAGAVSVQVLMNEAGQIIEAKAISGHPLLRAVCVAAARQSKFVPFTLGGLPVKVRGSIVYVFLSDSFNWLQIGYILQNQNNDVFYNYKNLSERLPVEFESERQMLQTIINNWENKDAILPSVGSSIEVKLSNKPKELWLFSLGCFLPEIENNIKYDEDARQYISQKLRLLLLTAPENVKPDLIVKLKRLMFYAENTASDAYDPATGSKSRETYNNLLENMSLLGR